MFFFYSPVSCWFCRNRDFQEVTLERDGETLLQFAAVYGFRNIQTLVHRMRKGRVPYQLVEVLSCPGGNVNPIILIVSVSRQFHSADFSKLKCYPPFSSVIYPRVSQGAWAAADRRRARREAGRIKPWYSRWRRPTAACQSVSRRSTPPCKPFIKTGCRARTPLKPARCCTPSTEVWVRSTHSLHTCSGEREESRFSFKTQWRSNESCLWLPPDSAWTISSFMLVPWRTSRGTCCSADHWVRTEVSVGAILPCGHRGETSVF